MNKWLISLLSVLFAFESAALTRLPEEFTIVERFFSLVSTFDVSTGLEPFAVARKRFLSLTPAFDLENTQGEIVATAKTRFFAWGTIADVTDSDDTPIGRIEEELIRILPWAEYKIYNRENQLVAIAKMDFLGTSFDLYHPDNSEEIYAIISRPFIRFYRDHWTVQIRNYSVFEENGIDPRLLILLALFQTDKDSRDRTRLEIQDQLRREWDDYEGRRVS